MMAYDRMVRQINSFIIGMKLLTKLNIEMCVTNLNNLVMK